LLLLKVGDPALQFFRFFDPALGLYGPETGV